jgi:hypothetical protein
VHTWTLFPRRPDHASAPFRVRVARFSPYCDASIEAPFAFDQVPQAQGWWTRRLWKAQGVGPVVEVYRLD